MMINGVNAYAQQAQQAQYAQIASGRADKDQDQDDAVTRAAARENPVTASKETKETQADRDTDARALKTAAANDSPLGGKDSAQKRGSLLDITV